VTACRLHPDGPARDCPACGLATDAEHRATVEAWFDANECDGCAPAPQRDVVGAIVDAARRRVAS
jgi:hypothetical protein